MESDERVERTLTVAGIRRAVDRVLLRVVGEDAHSWLNGQISNDVRALTAGGVVYALVLDARGKILADVWVLGRSANELWLAIPVHRSDGLLAHFDKYIVMEDVTVSAIPGPPPIAIHGPRAAEIAGEGYPVDPLGIGGRLVVGDDDAYARLRERTLAIGGTELSEEALTSLRVRLGRPAFGVDFDENAYPQEAGLQRIAVSFEKGCYLGQEVVCTLENRGRLSRRLVQLEGTGAVTPGTPLQASGAAIGTVTSVDPGRTLALGYVKRAFADPGSVLDGGVTVRALVEPTAGHSEGSAL